MEIDLNTLPEQVRTFVQRLIENAKKVEGWATCDMEGGKCFADTVVFVKREDDGSITMCDNYERFFDTIYTYTSDGKWSLRFMYADRATQPYTYEQALGDANCMFTG